VYSRHEAKREARILTATWIVLVSLTVGSFWLADPSTRASGAAGWVIGFATLKSHVIAGVFMEMRRGPLVWAAVMSGFLIAEAALIIVVLP
jgi:hypothetical protein